MRSDRVVIGEVDLAAVMPGPSRSWSAPASTSRRTWCSERPPRRRRRCYRRPHRRAERTPPGRQQRADSSQREASQRYWSRPGGVRPGSSARSRARAPRLTTRRRAMVATLDARSAVRCNHVSVSVENPGSSPIRRNGHADPIRIPSARARQVRAVRKNHPARFPRHDTERGAARHHLVADAVHGVECAVLLDEGHEAVVGRVRHVPGAAVLRMLEADRKREELRPARSHAARPPGPSRRSRAQGRRRSRAGS